MSAPKIGYVLKRYPRYSETFIVNEILAHEAAGQPIEIFSLRPVEETHFQDNLGKVRAPVTRLTERLKNPDAFWRLMMRARAGLPAASWTLLGQMKNSSGQDVAQALELAGFAVEPLASGEEALRLKKRSKVSEFRAEDVEAWQPADEARWTPEALGERPITDKKARKAAKEARLMAARSRAAEQGVDAYGGRTPTGEQD